ncbi:hypothetical protein [Leptolyngbya sp. 7M]|uniref:hypothetical protein n=1 Tax=Leptolyngbya sp. 7M TaxID=2812896 RepID=UPI001B8D9F8A|nr:hypothetical protein [Leptolyngbya sp. 7M]QYO65808.1 hypothetical protein JVX88_03150 [Leptolyngbya sp. 7M]
MPTPRFNFVSSQDIANGNCSYSEQDLMLIYEVKLVRSESETTSLVDSIDNKFNITPRQDLLVTADTLTLEFSGDSFCFKGLDAYTSKELWDESSSPVPDLSGSGVFAVDPNSLMNGSGDIDLELSYELSPSENWVRIKWPNETSANFFRVGTNMIIGLSRSLITDIYLLNVTFR